MGSEGGNETKSAEISKGESRRVSKSAESSRDPQSNRATSATSVGSVDGQSDGSDGNILGERNVRISKTGGLPSEAARELGLNEEEHRAVQKNLSEFWWAMTEEYSKQVVYDEALSKSAGDDVDCYRISALTEADRKLRMEGLLQELSESSSPEIGEKIFRGLDECSSFGYLGKFDVSLRFEPKTEVEMNSEWEPVGDPVIVPGDNVVKYVYSSPTTGKKAVSGTGNIESMNELFGGIFKPGREGDFGK